MRALRNDTDVPEMKKTAPRLLPLLLDGSASKVSPLEGPCDCLVGATGPETEMTSMASGVERAAFVASPSMGISAAVNHEVLFSQFKALVDAGDHEGAASTIQAACTVLISTGEFCVLNRFTFEILSVMSSRIGDSLDLAGKYS